MGCFHRWKTYIIGDLEELNDIINDILVIIGRKIISCFPSNLAGQRSVSETPSWARPCVDMIMVCPTWFVLLASSQKPSQGTPPSEEFQPRRSLCLFLVDMFESVLDLDEDDVVVASFRSAVGDEEEDDEGNDENDAEGNDENDDEAVHVEFDDCTKTRGLEADPYGWPKH
jgi:hypothetical protein